jgi:hypothetical protein
MKSEPVKMRKHRQTAALKDKPACGTLTYLAECRGTPQKTASECKKAPSAIVDMIVRKQPAAF